MNYTLGGFMGLGVVVLLSASMLVSYEVFRGPPHEMPVTVAFMKAPEAGALRVVSAPNVIYWDQLDVQGCSDVPLGRVLGGQLVRGCLGEVSIADRSSGRLLYQTSL